MRVLFAATAAIALLMLAVAVSCTGPDRQDVVSVEIGQTLGTVPSVGVAEPDALLHALEWNACGSAVHCEHLVIVRCIIASDRARQEYGHVPRLATHCSCTECTRRVRVVLKHPPIEVDSYGTGQSSERTTATATRSTREVLGVGVLA